MKQSSSFSEFLKNNQIDEKTHFLTHACSIYDLNGKIVRDYGGHHCLFESNGNYLIADMDNSLKYKDKFNKTIWCLPNIYAHHGLSVDSEKKFLVMGSTSTTKLNKKIRFDVFYKISHEGKIESKYDLKEKYYEYSNGQQLSSDLLRSLGPAEIFDNIKHEASHANTFNQINSLTLEDSIIKNGDYLINSGGVLPHMLIFDKKKFSLKKIIRTPTNLIHDTQMMSNGNIIFFNNFPGEEHMSTREERRQHHLSPTMRSIVETYNIANANISPYFTINNFEYFMPFAGSVQIFQDGSALIVDFKQGVSSIFFLKKDQSLIKKIVMDNSGKLGIAYIKLIDLSGFLRKNIGL